MPLPQNLSGANTDAASLAAFKQQAISAMLKQRGGFQKLAASMQQPLRIKRDYQAVGRKAFKVDQLPDGALAIYDKDPEVSAYVVSEDGESVQAILKPRRVNVPLIEIATAPMIPYQQVKERRFDLIERAQELAKSQIMQAEDDRVFTIIDTTANSGFDNIPGQTNPDIPVVAPLSGQQIADAFSLVERNNLRVAHFFLNARDYSDLRKFGREILDFETQNVLLNTGILGTIYGAKIIVSIVVPVGTGYVCAEPEYFGRIPVRTELTVLSADDPVKRQLGFSVFEQLGFICHNPLGTSRLVITR